MRRCTRYALLDGVLLILDYWNIRRKFGTSTKPDPYLT